MEEWNRFEPATAHEAPERQYQERQRPQAQQRSTVQHGVRWVVEDDAGRVVEDAIEPVGFGLGGGPAELRLFHFPRGRRAERADLGRQRPRAPRGVNVEPAGNGERQEAGDEQGDDTHRAPRHRRRAPFANREYQPREQGLGPNGEGGPDAQPGAHRPPACAERQRPVAREQIRGFGLGQRREFDQRRVEGHRQRRQQGPARVHGAPRQEPHRPRQQAAEHDGHRGRAGDAVEDQRANEGDQCRIPGREDGPERLATAERLGERMYSVPSMVAHGSNRSAQIRTANAIVTMTQGTNVSHDAMGTAPAGGATLRCPVPVEPRCVGADRFFNARPSR